jgi:hypothetical protein
MADYTGECQDQVEDADRKASSRKSSRARGSHPSRPAAFFHSFQWEGCNRRPERSPASRQAAIPRSSLLASLRRNEGGRAVNGCGERLDASHAVSPLCTLLSAVIANFLNVNGQAPSIRASISLEASPEHAYEGYIYNFAATFRNSIFWILPVLVFGSSSTSFTHSGHANPGSRFRAWAFSCVSNSAARPPHFSFEEGSSITNAIARSPQRGCARATTDTSSTSGCVVSSAHIHQRRRGRLVETTPTLLDGQTGRILSRNA